MLKRPLTAKASAEQVVKDIRHATCRLQSSEEKIWTIPADLSLENCLLKKDMSDPFGDARYHLPGNSWGKPGVI